ncbi:MAG: HAMP domain-containing histidine kinase [Flavobacteriaceae bacterium]|nr:HAMP domain-containing histidine kinase [Flavobacteriaceae bacterium]
MLEKKYKNIVYFIALTIIATIIAQVYWNVKNYEVNKQQVQNLIQTSFDDSVDKYYAEIAKNDVYKVIKYDTLLRKKEFTQPTSQDSKPLILKRNKNGKGFDTLHDSKAIFFLKNNKTPLTKFRIDSIQKKQIEIGRPFSDSIQIEFLNVSNSNKNVAFGTGLDSLELQKFANKIMLSFQDNILVLKKIDSLLIIELKRKNITLQYGLKYETEKIFSDKITTIKHKLENFPKQYTSTTSNSKFLAKGSKLTLLYTDTTSEILKRTLGSILLSLLLSLLIIGCLLFLLNTIFKQKQLAEVKNDLISNITHEFKTPIATIGVALESIQNFNAIDDAEKTKNYLNISNNQLQKLNTMVEKLLETATLDSNHLSLNKEKINVVELVKIIAKKHQMQTGKKTITYHKTITPIFIHADAFHLENAINNILDNAIKYGGNQIDIFIHQQKNKIEISITDDENTLKNSDKEKIFEQFYRVPKGNTHSVKGFGIGLYYARKIIEKHNGTIDLELKSNATTFKISLPNE